MFFGNNNLIRRLAVLSGDSFSDLDLTQYQILTPDFSSTFSDLDLTQYQI